MAAPTAQFGKRTIPLTPLDTGGTALQKYGIAVGELPSFLYADPAALERYKEDVVYPRHLRYDMKQGGDMLFSEWMGHRKVLERYPRLDPYRDVYLLFVAHARPERRRPPGSEARRKFSEDAESYFAELGKRTGRTFGEAELSEKLLSASRTRLGEYVKSVKRAASDSEARASRESQLLEWPAVEAIEFAVATTKRMYLVTVKDPSRDAKDVFDSAVPTAEFPMCAIGETAENGRQVSSFKLLASERVPPWWANTLYDTLAVSELGGEGPVLALRGGRAAVYARAAGRGQYRVAAYFPRDEKPADFLAGVRRLFPDLLESRQLPSGFSVSGRFLVPSFSLDQDVFSDYLLTTEGVFLAAPPGDRGSELTLAAFPGSGEPVTASLERSGEDLLVTINSAPDRHAAEWFRNVLQRALSEFSAAAKGIERDYRSLIPGWSPVASSGPVKKTAARSGQKVMDELRLKHPGMFDVPLFTRSGCTYPPRIVSKEKAEAADPSRVMLFPKDPSEGPQHYYECRDYPELSYPGLKVNRILQNRKEYPLIPCCYAEDQRAKRSTYSDYLEGALDRDVVPGKIRATLQLLPTVGSAGTSPVELRRLHASVARNGRGLFRLSVGGSLVGCVLAALGEGEVPEGLRDLERDARAQMARNPGNLFAAGAQSLRGASDAEIVGALERGGLPPRKYVSLVASFFGCDILMFDRASGAVLPDNAGGWYSWEEPGRKTFMVHLLGDHCELLVEGVSEKGFLRRRSADFAGTLFLEAATAFRDEQHAQFSGAERILPLSWPRGKDRIRAQATDSSGKVRGVLLGRGVVAQCTPLAPLKVPSNPGLLEGKPSKRDTVLKEFSEIGLEVSQVIDSVNGQCVAVVGGVPGSSPEAVLTSVCVPGDPAQNVPIAARTAVLAASSTLEEFRRYAHVARCADAYAKFLFTRSLGGGLPEGLSDNVLWTKVLEFAGRVVGSTSQPPPLSRIPRGIEDPPVAVRGFLDSRGRLLLPDKSAVPAIAYSLWMAARFDPGSLERLYESGKVPGYYQDAWARASYPGVLYFDSYATLRDYLAILSKDGFQQVPRDLLREPTPAASGDYFALLGGRPVLLSATRETLEEAALEAAPEDTQSVWEWPSSGPPRSGTQEPHGSFVRFPGRGWAAVKWKSGPALEMQKESAQKCSRDVIDLLEREKTQSPKKTSGVASRRK